MKASRPRSGEPVILKVAAGQDASPVVHRVPPFRIQRSQADEHSAVVMAHAGLAFVARMVDCEQHGDRFARVAPLRAARPRESPAWLAGVFALYLDERVHVAVKHEAAEEGSVVLYPGDVAAATRRVTRGWSRLEPERREVTRGGSVLARGRLGSSHIRAGLIDPPAARHPKARGAHGPTVGPRCHRARRQRTKTKERKSVERIARRLVGHSRNGRRGEWRAVHPPRALVFRSVAYLLGLRRSSARSARPAHHLDVGIMCCYRVGAFL